MSVGIGRHLFSAIKHVENGNAIPECNVKFLVQNGESSQEKCVFKMIPSECVVIYDSS